MNKLIKLSLLISMINLVFSNLVYAEELVYSKNIALKESRINPDEKTRVMLFTSQFSIFPQFNQPAVYLQTPVIQGVDPLSALIGALIGARMVNQFNQSDRDTAIAFNNGLNEALSEININQEIQAALTASLSQHHLFKQLTFEEVGHINELAQAGLLIKIEEPSTLTLSTRVYFDAQLKSVYLETNTKIWKKNETKPIYFSELNYSSAYLTESSKSELRGRWIADHGALLKAKIREGIVEITHMLIQDLLENQTVETASQHPLVIETLNANTSKKLKTTLYKLEETPDRLIGRLGAPDSSILASIPKTNFTAISSN